MREHPEVEVRVQGGSSTTMRARIVDREEGARLWPLIVAVHAPYAGYRTKTSREIPIVSLEPVS